MTCPPAQHFTAEEIQFLEDIGGLRTDQTPAEFMGKAVEIRPECAGRRRILSPRVDPLYMSQQVNTSKGDILMERAVHRALSAPIVISAGVEPGAPIYSGLSLSSWGGPSTRVYGQVRSTCLITSQLD